MNRHKAVLRAIRNFAIWMYTVHILSALQILPVEPNFGGNPFNSDQIIAGELSGLNLFSTATNRWRSASEIIHGSLCLRSTLNRETFRVDEPVHLFFYIQNCSSEFVRLPKFASWEYLRLNCYDRVSGNPIEPNSLGKWFLSRGDPVKTGASTLVPGRVFIGHLDLSELFILKNPGEYTLQVTLLLEIADQNVSILEHVVLSELAFSVSSQRFQRPKTSQVSDLASYYQQIFSSGSGPPMTEREQELMRENSPELKTAHEEAQRLRSESLAQQSNARAAQHPVSNGQSNDGARGENVPTVNFSARHGSPWRQWAFSFTGSILVLCVLVLWYFRRRS